MSSVAKIYTDVQFSIAIGLSVVLIVYGLVMRSRTDPILDHKLHSQYTLMAKSGFSVLIFMLVLSYMRKHFKNFDNYFTAFGILS